MMKMLFYIFITANTMSGSEDIEFYYKTHKYGDQKIEEKRAEPLGLPGKTEGVKVCCSNLNSNSGSMKSSGTIPNVILKDTKKETR